MYLAICFSEGYRSPTRAGQQTKLKTNINPAVLSRPTPSTSFKQTISVPSKASLVEKPPVPVLLLPTNARISPVYFLKVPLGPIWSGDETNININTNSAQLSRPTRIITFKQTISVPSKASLVEAPPVPVLLLVLNASIRSVSVLGVPEAQLGPGSGDH